MPPTNNHHPKLDGPKGGATFFAPAERATSQQVDELVKAIVNEPVVNTVLRTVDGLLVILNPQRQILTANQTLLETLGVDLSDCLGKRPGEALGCVYHQEGPGGCGTSRHCSKCGAVLAIMASQVGREPVEAECWMTRNVGGTLESAEFRVRSTPITVGGLEVYAFVLNDISFSKRKDALERVFFHDITNLIGGLLGCMELWEECSETDFKGLVPMASNLVKRLSLEIENHRVLLEAEQGDLVVKWRLTSVNEILAGLPPIFHEHEAAKGKMLIIQPPRTGYMLRTDSSLLSRVLTNMIKNALEAVTTASQVRAWFEIKDGAPTFFVHNPGVIPEDTALGIFQRSFSTKNGPGRGLGTYGMKVLGENYLKGKVGFTSTEAEGTLFFISLPPNQSAAV
ncbi:MAG: HAMP domain-containing sensor histidine kinase [Pseudomonadota bacterium]